MYTSTFIFRLLTATVGATAYVRSAASFQPSSDYNVYKTTNLYNCTGRFSASNVTATNAVDTLPQIEPSAGLGWEQWTLFVHGTFPIIMRWNQGDPSSPVPSPAQFDLLILDVNGTTVQGTVVGELSYTNDENFKRIAIGENSVTWDSSSQWYNASVKVDGYEMELDSFSATLDAFHPNVAFYNGMLDQSGGWFGSVPLIRGHAGGTLDTPKKQTLALDGLSVMRHMFSERPLPDYLHNYTAGTAWSYSASVYDTHVFYQAETVDGTVHEAAYLGRAIPTPGLSGVFSSAWAMYAITDDPALYGLTIDPATYQIQATLPGCADTDDDDVPYVFDMRPATLLGEFADVGGGRTSYYNINGTASAPYDGSTVDGSLAGVLEVYLAPTSCS